MALFSLSAAMLHGMSIRRDFTAVPPSGQDRAARPISTGLPWARHKQLRKLLLEEDRAAPPAEGLRRLRAHVGAKHLRDRPGLRDAPSGRVRLVGVEDLAERAD